MLAKNLGNWPQTNMEQEEEAAKHRWDRLTEQEREQRLQQAKSSAEPYMLDGYEDFAKLHGQPVERKEEYNRAIDPVYSSREWWQHGQEAQNMEHQYGMIEQMRIYGYGAVNMDGDEEML